MNQEEPTKPTPQSPPSAGPRRLKNVDLDKIQQKFLIILEREVNRLMDESHEKLLGEESAKKLINYLKFMPELREFEAEMAEELPEDELKKIAKQGDPR